MERDTAKRELGLSMERIAEGKDEMGARDREGDDRKAGWEREGKRERGRHRKRGGVELKIGESDVACEGEECGARAGQEDQHPNKMGRGGRRWMRLSRDRSQSKRGDGETATPEPGGARVCLPNLPSWTCSGRSGESSQGSS